MCDYYSMKHLSNILEDAIVMCVHVNHVVHFVHCYQHSEQLKTWGATLNFYQVALIWLTFKI